MIEAPRSEVVFTGPNGEPLIRKTPDVCGGDACIGNSRIMVWLLVSFKKQGMTEEELLENYPTLTRADLEAAWAYNELHPQEIQEAKARQDPDPEDD
jgi:uncharacterized protein (DUF433 family)